MLLNASLLNDVLLNGDSVASSISSSGTGRFISQADFERITSRSYAVFARVRIPDPSGKVWEYANRDGINWIHSISYEENVNAPIGTATMKLWRAVGGKSLAPLRTNSSYNQIDFTEGVFDPATGQLIPGKGPSIDAGRRMTIDVACPPLGTDPNSLSDSDYHTVFDGYIDSVDWAANPIVIEARDLGALLQDVWYPTPGNISPLSFGDPNGDGTLNIQQLLSALLGSGISEVGVTLFVPNPPSPAVIVVTSAGYAFDMQAEMDALQTAAQIIGWVVRYRWSDADQMFRFTFFDPGRSKTVPDYELPPSAYIDITQAKIDVTGIRNDVTISYRPDNDTGTPRVTINQRDPESVRRYHTRSMVLQEADTSPINSADSANGMGELIVFDLAQPVADQTVVMPFAWFVELYDFIRFIPNGVTHDEPLDLGVVSVKHTIQDGNNRTIVQARGRPASSYWNWLGRRPALPGQVAPTDPPGSPVPGGFASLTQTPNFSTDHVTFNWAWGGDAGATFEVWVQLGTTGFNLATTVGVGVHTYDYDVGADIEPFRLPPDPPQIALEIDFYIRAIVSGSPVATSATSFAQYGHGP